MDYLNNDNLPLGAYNDSKAPYNEEISKPKSISVTISVTMSRTICIDVDDYTVTLEEDDEGILHPHYDFSDCNLKEAVLKQCILPFNFAKTGKWIPRHIKDSLRRWNIDDFEVICNE